MMLDTLADKFWHQLVRGPTHRLGNTLDLCLASSMEFVVGVEVTAPLGNSDHNGLEVTLLGKPPDNSSKEEVPDWSKANMERMREMLGEVDWEVELGQLGGRESMDKFYQVVDRVTRECVPTKMRRAGTRPLWMTQNIMRMIRRKRRLWRAYSREEYYRQDYSDYLAYQEVQREMRKEIKKTKRKLEKGLAKKARKDPKRFYSYLKSKTCNRVSGGPLMGEEGLVTGSSEMAGILNAQYTSVFISEDMTNLPDPEVLFTGEDRLADLRFEVEEVEKKLKNLKSCGAPGPDRVWSKVLHSMADILAGPLAIIYNKLMEEGNVPNIWRMANVWPIFKNSEVGSDKHVWRVSQLITQPFPCTRERL